MLKATKPAKASDYQKLVVAASEVVVRTRRGSLQTKDFSGEPDYIVVEFPYFIKFQKGFPTGKPVERGVSTNTYHINAIKLLDWLHQKGYSTYSAKQLVQRTKDYERLDASIDRMFDQFN
jgi:hypothetical protein